MNTLIEFPGIFLTAVIYSLLCNIFWLCRDFKAYKDIVLFTDKDFFPIAGIVWAFNFLGVLSLVLYFIYL
jgi:hypothetical protein